jgi:hypothetical protein
MLDDKAKLQSYTGDLSFGNNFLAGSDDVWRRRAMIDAARQIRDSKKPTSDSTPGNLGGGQSGGGGASVGWTPNPNGGTIPVTPGNVNPGGGRPNITPGYDAGAIRTGLDDAKAEMERQRRAKEQEEINARRRREEFNANPNNRPISTSNMVLDVQAPKAPDFEPLQNAVDDVRMSAFNKLADEGEAQFQKDKRFGSRLKRFFGGGRKENTDAQKAALRRRNLSNQAPAITEEDQAHDNIVNGILAGRRQDKINNMNNVASERLEELRSNPDLYKQQPATPKPADRTKQNRMLY